MFEGESIDDVIAKAKEEGVGEATINDDGSVTYKMSKSVHNKIMKEMEDGVLDYVKEIKESGDYVSIKDVTHNKSFSEFTLAVDQELYENSFDGFVSMGIGMMAMYYQLFDGVDPDNYKVTISIKNADTGDIFNTIIYPDALEETLKDSSQNTTAASDEDFWTVYDNATWEDDFKGLKTSVLKVAVSDRAPNKDDSTKSDGSIVGVKFRIENTTDGKFTTYPDQARLVTSTGEQIDMPDMWLSDNIGGEIDKGVTKEGSIVWYLERGQIENITWIKLEWNSRVGPDDDYLAERKDYEIELKLK